MGKKRVSIYIDEDVWDYIKEEAWKLRTSASGLLEEIACGDRPVVPIKETGLMIAHKESVEALVDVDLESENLKLIEKRKKVEQLKSDIAKTNSYQSIQMNPQPKSKWKKA